MKVTLVVLCALVGLSAASTIPGSNIFSEWEGRIVGGANALAGQFPYQASLRTAGDFHFCGGWVHNNRWIVSAAHCTIDRNTDNTFVVLGALQRTSGGTYPGINYPTSAVVNHPSYNANTLANDISLIQTRDTIVYTANIRSIPLGTAHIGGDVLATASGWGQTEHPGNAAETLQWLQMRTMTHEACRAAHSIINRSRVHENTICTTSPVGQGMCMGDSGGPLAVGNTIVGAVSWGIPCGNAAPDVFARVSSHAPWILSVAQEHN